MTQMFAAIETAEAQALAAHNAGTCGESEYSCSWCESANNHPN